MEREVLLLVGTRHLLERHAGRTVLTPRSLTLPPLSRSTQKRVWMFPAGDAVRSLGRICVTRQGERP